MSAPRLPATAVSLNDRGLAYGDGLFETLRAHHGRLPFLPYHLNRLRNGLERLDLEADLEAVAAHLQDRAIGQAQALIKLLLVRNVGRRGYAPDGRSCWYHAVCYPLPAVRDRGEGIRVACAALRLGLQPALAGIKHLSRLEQVLAAREQREKGVDELWIADSAGYLVSGVQSNVLLVQDQRVLAPPLDQCGVAGTTRAWALDHLRRQGVPVVEQPVLLEQALEVEAACMTSAAQGVMAVGRVGARVLDVAHPLIRALQQAWQARLCGQPG